MIAKLNRRSGGSGATAYLLSLLNWLGELRHAAPEILFGYREIFDLCVQISGYAQPYLSGELSWEEDYDKVGRDAALAAVMAYVRLLAAGIPLSEFALLIVLHRRKRGFDIHFVISKVHLRTTLQFRFYRNTDSDEALGRTWRLHTNRSQGWSDPKDPEHRSLKSHPSRYLSPAERRAHQFLDERVTQWVLNENVTSYAEVIALIKSGGIPLSEITDETGRKRGIKVTYDGQHLTLLGGKYTPGFDYESARRNRATPRKRSPEAIAKEIADLGKKLDRFRSRRERIYQAAFAGGSPLFPCGPEAGMGHPDQGVLHSLGAAGGPGATIPPRPGNEEDGGAEAPPEALPDGIASGAGASPSLPCGDGTPDGRSSDRDPKDLGAAGPPNSGGGESPAELASGPTAPATRPKGQGDALPLAGWNMGGSGVGRETTIDGHPFREPGGRPPGVADPAKAIQATETLKPGEHHEPRAGTHRINRIIAELVRRFGQALSGARDCTARAERALEALAGGAGREREAFERIGRNLQSAGSRDQGAEEGQQGATRGDKDVDDDYQKAVRELGRAVDDFGQRLLAHEVIQEPVRPSIRPLMPGPKQRPRNIEPTR